MNRAQRRAARGPVAEIERLRIAKTAELEAQAIELRRWITEDATEPISERLRLVEGTIADLDGDPAARLLVGPALVILRGLRDDLANRARLS